MPAMQLLKSEAKIVSSITFLAIKTCSHTQTNSKIQRLYGIKEGLVGCSITLDTNIVLELIKLFWPIPGNTHQIFSCFKGPFFCLSATIR